MSPQTTDFVLASSSPQRTLLLDQMGIRHRVLPVDFHEDHSRENSPEELVHALARDKLLTAMSIPNGDIHTGAIIMTADTIVALGNTRLGKPETRAAAAEYLRMLSDKEHRVISSLALFMPRAASADMKTLERELPIQRLYPDSIAKTDSSERDMLRLKKFADAGNIICIQAISKIRLVKIEPWELNTYLEWNEWRGAAGGYRVQGRAGCFVKKIEGSFTNIVGLPIELLYGILRRTSFWAAP